jgi:hypothetical protein
MTFNALYLIPGRGWVAAMTIDAGEVYKVGDKIVIGNISWVIRGVELQRHLGRLGKDIVGQTGIGLQVVPEKLFNKYKPAKRKKTTEEIIEEVKEHCKRAMKPFLSDPKRTKKATARIKSALKKNLTELAKKAGIPYSAEITEDKEGNVEVAIPFRDVLAMFVPPTRRS